MDSAWSCRVILNERAGKLEVQGLELLRLLREKPDEHVTNKVKEISHRFRIEFSKWFEEIPKDILAFLYSISKDSN